MAKTKTSVTRVRVCPSWRRLVAFMVDFFVLFTAALYLHADSPMMDGGLSLTHIGGLVFGDGDHGSLLGFVWTIMGLGILYGWVFESFTRTTPGKRLVGAEVCSRNGERPRIVHTLMRNVIKFLGLILLGLPSLWAFFDGNRASVYDRLTGLLVVERNSMERN